jgi:hypothetical protein
MGEAIHVCASLYNDGYVSSPIAWQWHIFVDQCERKERVLDAQGSTSEPQLAALLTQVLDFSSLSEKGAN